jgi:hypothetical protein
MSTNTVSSKTKSDPIPDSLIDLLCTRAKWEQSVMEEIQAAHGKEDTKQVMALLAKFFTEGPGSMKGNDHDTKA